MNGSQIVCLSFLVVAVFARLAHGSWDQSHRDQILKIHNDYRAGTKGACDLKPMKYDRQLESEAQAWAAKCEFRHQMKGRGENIAWYTKYGKEATLVEKMAAMWYGEIKDFNYNSNGCGAACHYTQLVWSDTTNVGCYAQDCSNLKYGGSNAYFLVCFYNPPGNFMGQKPYKKDCSAKASNGNRAAQNNNGWGNDDGWESW